MGVVTTGGSTLVEDGVRTMSEFARLDWTAWSTPFVLFTGKGGVGKTTIASTAAVALADAGRRVLLVSTDPASNLPDVFAMRTGEQPRPVAGVHGLDVIDLDPLRAADEYRARVIDPYRNVLPPAQMASLVEQLAGACTVEVAAFDAFARLLADPAGLGMYDHILFDTAPTGHTLRLLSLPAAWSAYLSDNPGATTCLGPRAGLRDDRPLYVAAVEALRDASSTSLVLVSRPERAALAVAAVAAEELAALGIRNLAMVVNGVLVEPTAGDAVADSYASMQHHALRRMPPVLAALPTSIVPLRPFDVVGVDALRLFGSSAVDIVDHADGQSITGAPDRSAHLSELVDEIERSGRVAILVTGKGGVGKTTVASLLAVELARRGRRVHLSTTDPAGHVAPVVDTLPTLTTSAIDPEEATREYVDRRMRSAARQGLDHERLELLAEDLRSPCSREVAVFEAFHRVLGRARDQFVIIDTAPTGHTLLLLDTTGAYHRQSLEGAGPRAGRTITPLMRLQDSSYSKVLIVTMPETTPVREASSLQDDLRRAGIEPYGWIVNATLADSGTNDRVLAARALLERTQLERVTSIAARVWTLPWKPSIALCDESTTLPTPDAR